MDQEPHAPQAGLQSRLPGAETIGIGAYPGSDTHLRAHETTLQGVWRRVLD
jgi:hypothetical protein